MPKNKYIEHASGWLEAINNIAFHQPLFNGSGHALIDQGIFSCPAAVRGNFPSNWDFPAYGYNAHGLGDSHSNLGLGGIGIWTAEYRPTPRSDIVSPSTMRAIGDGFCGWNESLIESDLFARSKIVTLSPERGGSARSKKRHENKANIVFCDGHTSSVPLKTLFIDASDQALEAWNKDNRPHPEMLQ